MSFRSIAATLSLLFLASCASLQAMDANAASDASSEEESILGPMEEETEGEATTVDGDAEEGASSAADDDAHSLPQAGMIDTEVSYEAKPEPEPPPPPKPKPGQKPPQTIKKADIVAEGAGAKK
jgi:hypothetical protein